MHRIVLRRGGLAILILLAIGVAGLFGQVANGGFETNTPPNTFASWTVADQPGGSGSWFVQTGTGSPLNGFSVPAPPEGTFAAMTDQSGPGSHILYQDITVPCTGGTLTFDVFIQNQAGAFFIPSPETLDFNAVPNQHARVDIMTTLSPVFDVGTGVLQNVFITNPGDPATSGYNKVSVPLQPWAGQTVRLRFAEVDNQLFFNMGIDNVVMTAGTGTLFGTDGSGGNLLRIDPSTGVGTVVGQMEVGQIPSLAVDPTTFIMYAGHGAGTPNVYTVNTATGEAKLLGDSLLGFAAIGAMDFRADGTLFAAVNIVGDGGTGSDHLATISKTDGSAAVIGPFGTCPPASLCTIEGMEAIAFDAAGTLWGAVSARGPGSTPGLYTINTGNGAATFRVPILDSAGNPPSGGIVSLQFDCDGTLFGGTARAAGAATDGGRLVTINPVTGLFSFVGAVSATGGPSLAALALDKICACCPPPAFVKNIGKATLNTNPNKFIVIPVASAVTAGNTIIVGFASSTFAGPVGCSDTKGNSYSIDADKIGPQGRVTICSATATTALVGGVGGDTITASYPKFSGPSSASANEFSGLIRPFDQQSTASGNSSSPSSGPVTISQPELLYGAIFFSGTNSATFTPGAGFTLTNPTLGSFNNRPLASEYKFVSTGTNQANGTLTCPSPPNCTNQWTADIATYRVCQP